MRRKTTAGGRQHVTLTCGMCRRTVGRVFADPSTGDLTTGTLHVATGPVLLEHGGRVLRPAAGQELFEYGTEVRYTFACTTAGCPGNFPLRHDTLVALVRRAVETGRRRMALGEAGAA